MNSLILLIASVISGVSPCTIAVQSPYISQVQLLRERFDELSETSGIEVATIDSFQGREADAVVISMVYMRLTNLVILLWNNI